MIGVLLLIEVVSNCHAFMTKLYCKYNKDSQFDRDPFSIKFIIMIKFYLRFLVNLSLIICVF